MDKMMKRILKYLNEQEAPSSHIYDFDSDLEEIATALNTDKDAVRLCIRRLAKYEYINSISDQNGRHIRFSLDHKGLRWKEYRRKEIRDYLADKWIDCFAMLLSLAALAMSAANFFGWSSRG